MTQAIRRACLRTGLVLAAVGVVVAATFILTPRFDPKKAEAALAARAVNRAPMPGSETALRRAIAEAQSGVPDYDRAKKARMQLLASITPLQRVFVALEGGIPVLTDKDILAAAREQQQDLAKFGPLQSSTYLGGLSRFDSYRVTFRNGSLLWLIGLEKNGTLADYNFGPEGIGSPQNFIDNYARFRMRERSARMATQLGILLAVAAFGRLVMRLRL